MEFFVKYVNGVLMICEYSFNIEEKIHSKWSDQELEAMVTDVNLEQNCIKINGSVATLSQFFPCNPKVLGRVSTKAKWVVEFQRFKEDEVFLNHTHDPFSGECIN